MTHGLRPGDRIAACEDLIHRQIPATWFDAGRPCEHAFRPNENDAGELSVYWGRLITPEESFRLHLKNNLKSVGVYSISVSECGSIDLPVHYDPMEDNISHSYVNYKNVITRGEKKAKSMQLRSFALERGATYNPPTQDVTALPPAEPESE